MNASWNGLNAARAAAAGDQSDPKRAVQKDTPIDEQPREPEPSPEDWKRAALELAPPQDNQFPATFALWMVFSVIPTVVLAVILLLLWLLR